MYLSKARVRNFRLLRDTTFELETDEKKDLSILIGKNNSGKTSFIMAFDKFFRSQDIDFNDFPIYLREKILNFNEETDIEELAIILELEIIYNENDNLNNISNFFVVDVDNCKVNLLLKCEVMRYDLLKDLKEIRTENKKRFIKKSIQNYFNYKLFAFNEEAEIYKEQKFKTLFNLINYEVIHAKREVASSESNIQKGNVLSNLSTRYYDSDNKISFDDLSDINSSMIKMDKTLDLQYNEYFNPFLNAAKSFLPENHNLKVISDLQSQSILKNHSRVVYGEGENYLPEHLNGLGYLNILYLLLNIEIKKELFINNRKDLNFLFIEEPEAHTHPQMQYVFIEKIKSTIENINKGYFKEKDFVDCDCDESKLYKELQKKGIINTDGLIQVRNSTEEELSEIDFTEFNDDLELNTIVEDEIRNVLKAPNNLQTIISSHSAHIVKRCDFKDIRYFRNYIDGNKNNNVEIKNFYGSLKELYKSDNPDEDKAEKEHFQFLRQYLSIEASELFFAKKIIFIEGVSESLLLPYFINKLDEENPELGLSTQNISILEVGANSRVFKHFLTFFDIKTLIITDIDTTKKNNNKRYAGCEVDAGTNTSNYSLKYFLSAPAKKDEPENFEKWLEMLKADELQNNPDRNINVSYQTRQNNYHARSFEDSFIAANLEKLVENKGIFEDFDFESTSNIFELTKEVLKEFDKSKFASTILYSALTENINWNIPQYIKTGLEWTAQD